MDKAAIQVALGIKPDLNISSSKFAFIKYQLLPLGKEVIQVGNLDSLLKLPGVIFVHVFVKSGDIIEALTHSAQRPSCVIVSGESRSKCIELMNEYENILRKLIILN